MELVPVLASEQQLGIYTVLYHFRRAPFAGDQRVVPEVPPEVVAEVLRPPAFLSGAPDFEGLGVEHEDPSGPVTVDRAESVHVDSVGTAVGRVRP